MTTTTTAAARRTVLDNGLRVLVRPGSPPGAAAVSVHCAAGFRSDPPGLPGLAHLVEHLAFRGRGAASADRPRGLVEGLGGAVGATTHPDYTDFFAAAPVEALPELLAVEAARMSGLEPVEPDLAAERRTVLAERSRRITGRPYGGFPWIGLSGLLHDTYATGHDGYGRAADLERVTAADCTAFFARHHGPGSSVLTVVGDVDPAEVLDRVGELFGPLPRTAPPPARPVEPPPAADRSGRDVATGIPLPALAVGYRVPDPAADPDGYAAHVLLAAALAGPLAERLTAPGLAGEASARVGLMGAAWDVRDPDAFVVTVLHPPGADRAAVLAGFEAAVGDVALGRVPRGELEAIAALWTCARLRESDQLQARTRRAGARELLFGPDAAEPDLRGAVGGLRRVAAELLERHRAVLHLDREETR